MFFNNSKEYQRFRGVASCEEVMRRDHEGGLKGEEQWRNRGVSIRRRVWGGGKHTQGGRITHADEESWRRNHGGGIIDEESWRRNHGGGIMKEESSRRNHEGAIIMEES